jgi:hypothetical protein
MSWNDGSPDLWKIKCTFTDGTFSESNLFKVTDNVANTCSPGNEPVLKAKTSSATTI